jgi:hypothetical protein
MVIASGKTVTFSNTLTIAGTDGTTMTFPATSATIARTDAANTFTGNQTFGNTALKLNDSDATHTVTIAPGDESANRQLNIPVLGGTDTIMTLGTAQTVTGVKTMSGANVITHAPTGLKVQDSDATHVVTIAPGNEAADRTLSIPVMGGADTMALLALAQTFAGAKTFTAAIIPTGGVAAAGGFTASARNIHTGGVPASVSTFGTELDIVVTELYVAEVFIPANCTVTGMAVFNGTNSNGNMKVMLFNSAGTRVALSASTDVSADGADAYGARIAFSAPYAAVGPATYYVGVICDTNTHDLNTHTMGNFGAGKIESLVYATEAGYATITPPTTFTTGLGPVATLY